MSFDHCVRCKTAANLQLRNIRSDKGYLVITVVCERTGKRGKACGKMHVLRYKQCDKMTRDQRRRYVSR